MTGDSTERDQLCLPQCLGKERLPVQLAAVRDVCRRDGRDAHTKRHRKPRPAQSSGSSGLHGLASLYVQFAQVLAAHLWLGAYNLRLDCPRCPDLYPILFYLDCCAL